MDAAKKPDTDVDNGDPIDLDGTCISDSGTVINKINKDNY